VFSCSQATSPAARGLRLARHDEFSGTSLDSRAWSTVMDFPGRAGGHYHNTSYGSYAVDENVVLSHGRLRLITDDEPVVGTDLWPAFWLIPQDRSWPPEIDVAEWFGSIQGMHSGLASGNWPDVRWDSHWSYGAGPAQGWHTYGVLWQPGRLVFYTDGAPTYTVTGDQVPDKAMYIVLNSGTWANADRGGPPDHTTAFPNAFEVDYVRVYQRPRS
jgi:hypothetical protein